MLITKLHRLFITFSLIFMTCQLSHSQVNTDQVMRVGQNAMYFEDYVLAIQYFNQAAAAKPYLAQPYFLRSIAKLNLEDYDGAIADASKAIKLNPFIPDAWEVRGVARQNLGRYDGAVADYRHALSLLPRNRQLLYNMAMAQIELKDYNAADSTFAELTRYYPKFANAYIGRARLNLVKTDTVAAQADIDHALQLNRNAFNAYVMRADIAINSARDYARALDDMNEAVKLEPRLAGLYINRAFLRYKLNDYFGAMADYDYAIELEPLNEMALYNRGIMLMEVNDNDRALGDFSNVLSLNPDDLRARYNRAVIYKNKHMWKESLADVDKFIAAFPDFPGGYYLRCDINRQRGNLRQAEADYKKAVALSRKLPKHTDDTSAGASTEPSDDTPEAIEASTRNLFATLLTTEKNARVEEEYNNNSIRGRVQDREINVATEPMMELSFYSSPTQLRQGTYYIKEIDDLNSTRILRMAIVVTNHPPVLTDADIIDKHFDNIQYYNSYLSTHTPRTVDYIGRALDLITVRNYAAAIADIDRALALNPDFAPSYMLRAQAAYKKLHLDENEASPDVAASARTAVERMAFQNMIADLDLANKYSVVPNAVIWYNKGVILTEMGDFTSAISAFNKAIEIKADMGEAYYNRGYIYLKLGNRERGISDLGKAGELGIVPAYNLLKRMSR